MAPMNRPTPVEVLYKNKRFLITHNPTNATLMKYKDAVQFIRQKRCGTFNSKQLLYLEKYCPNMWLCFKDSNGHGNNCYIQ
uniref:Uncharacterized protein n=1 Tax=Marmota marmota marmota TaxID=9994 RepID=A0A8C5YRR3_MARMA